MNLATEYPVVRNLVSSILSPRINITGNRRRRSACDGFCIYFSSVNRMLNNCRGITERIIK